jgi:DNA-binding NarL/FixJ family response regulator
MTAEELTSTSSCPSLDTMPSPLRLIIADDHALFRQGLRSLLRLQPDIEVVAEVERAGDILSILASTPCDALLLDLQMERWSLQDIESLARLTQVIVLTASERVEDAVTAIRLGARAVVQKRYAIETLQQAIRAVADGFVWMPPALQTELAVQWGTPDDKKLTTRESEIVRQVSLGLRNFEVAERLRISEGTVKTHLNNIFHKLGLRDRVELALYALRVGLANLPREGG